tara:strand:- start:429 stop:860 length:432 start_codon:yes stop_codon:yes gene_type:complete
MDRLIDKCYVKSSGREDAGYGVYADEDILKDDIVMECVIPTEFLTKNTYSMRSYRVAWQLQDENSYEDDFIPLGKMGIVNCSVEQVGGGRVPIESNLRFEVDKTRRLIAGIALCDISKDKEMFWDYGIGSRSPSKSLVPDEIS